MREQGIPQGRIRETAEHSCLPRRQQLARLGTEHGKPQDAIAPLSISIFMKPRGSDSVRVRSTAAIGIEAVR